MGADPQELDRAAEDTFMPDVEVTLGKRSSGVNGEASGAASTAISSERSTVAASGEEGTVGNALAMSELGTPSETRKGVSGDDA